MFCECRSACDSASTRPSRCGQRACRTFCSQIRRQSVRHSPWHLNSLPGPPILPPHPGQTQFRMPDITSPLPATVIQFTFVDCISTSRKKKFSSFHVATASTRNSSAPSGCQRSHTLRTECISCSKREERQVCARGSCELHLRNGVLPRGIRAVYGNVPRAAVAFAVPPTPVSSSRCKGGSCSSHLQDRQAYSLFLLIFALHVPESNPLKNQGHPCLCDLAFETSLNSLPVDMRTVASAAGCAPLFTAPSPGWSISLKTRH